jgi:acylphosphatase
MNSQGHRETLLNPVYRESGVAVVLGVAERGPEADRADAGAIFVQTFGGCALRELPFLVMADIGVGRAADGRIEIFVQGSDGHVWHLWQTAPNGDWSEWEDLSTYRRLGVGAVGEPGGGRAADGRIEIFVQSSDGHVWHLWQTAPNGDWSEWEDLSTYRRLGVGAVGEPGVGSAADGRIEIFVQGSDSHVLRLWQTAPNGNWSEWEDLSTYRRLGVGAVGEPGVGSAADGRIEIFVQGSDGHVWHLWQTAPNGDWSEWKDLST